MMTNRFLRMRPTFILIALLLLVSSGLAWANTADDEDNETVSQIQMTKTVDTAEQKAGRTVKFTVTIRNNGDETATLTLVDTMPDQMRLQMETVDAPVNFDGGLTDSVSAGVGTLTWEGRMFSGGEVVITYAAEIDETAEIDDVLTNEAVVTNDADGASTTASASVTVSRFSGGVPFVFLPMLSWAGDPGLCYQEQNNVVVLDITRQRPNGWDYIVDEGAIIEGYYRWPGSDYGIGGFGTLDYIIRIDNPGRYYMRMHSYANHPSESDKSNDMYMSVEGEPWEKTVGWSYQWKEWGWATGHELHAGRTPFWEFPTAGDYEFKISARSNQFGIDRMAFYQSDALGFSEPADHQDNRTLRNQIDNTLDEEPLSELCTGYVPPYFDR